MMVSGGFEQFEAQPLSRTVETEADKRLLVNFLLREGNPSDPIEAPGQCKSTPTHIQVLSLMVTGKLHLT